jgi:hypothetical protein
MDESKLCQMYHSLQVQPTQFVTFEVLLFATCIFVQTPNILTCLFGAKGENNTFCLKMTKISKVFECCFNRVFKTASAAVD